jgi:8-oxo-dGTP pyrophosphatase MutT (NUDIX family)
MCNDAVLVHDDALARFSRCAGRPIMTAKSDMPSSTQQTAPPRRFSAGAVVVRRFPQGWRYLILRSWRNWDFPKGTVEEGEAPLVAAIREVAEESALTDIEFRWGEIYCETAPYSRGKIARYYLGLSPAGKADLPVNPELGRPEHHEFQWVDFATAQKLLPLRLQLVLRWAREKVGDA